MKLGKSLNYETGVYQSGIQSITDNYTRKGQTEDIRIELIRPLRRMKQRVKATLNDMTRIDSLRFFTIIDFDDAELDQTESII